MGNKGSKHRKHSHSDSQSPETSPRRSPVEQAAEIYSTPQVHPVGHPPGQVLQLHPSTTSLGVPAHSDHPTPQETPIIHPHEETSGVHSHHERSEAHTSTDHSHSKGSGEHSHSKVSGDQNHSHAKKESSDHRTKETSDQRAKKESSDQRAKKESSDQSAKKESSDHSKESIERLQHEKIHTEVQPRPQKASVPQIAPPLPSPQLVGTPPSSSPKSAGSPRLPEDELSAGSYENLENLRILSESQSYTGKGSLQNPKYNGFGGQQVRIVVIGESKCGKTSLIERYTKKKFVDDVKAPVHEQFVKLINQPDEDAPLEITIIDTANTQIHSKVRSLGYETADVFVVCFSLADPQSIIQLRTKWIPELIIEGKIVTRNIPFLLVGCKSDQRVQESNFLPEKILQFAHHIKAAKYIECSAKSGENCVKVIHEAISACSEQEFEDD